MGIYDREYYRNEGPSFLGSIANQGQVVKWLIGINVVVFILQCATQSRPGGDPLTDALILNGNKVLGGEVWRLLTYAFLHASIWHLFFNMWVLWMFGADMEEMYGSLEFLAFYLSAAVFSGMVFVSCQLVRGDVASVLGASGAITAVTILCAFHYPYRPILVFFVIPVPLWMFAIMEVGLNSLVFLGRLPTSVAVTAHLGGAVFGFAYFKLERRITSLWTSLSRTRLSRPRLRLYTEEDENESRAVSVTAPAGADLDEQLEAKVDAVLEKMALLGKESLSESERDVLLRASELYRKRRR